MLSLLFGQGQRPDDPAIEVLSGTASGFPQFTISHRPAEEEGWVELLASGLTFDCRGLAPAAPQPAPPVGTLLGLAAAPPGEAITLAPGPHLAEGGGLLPVVRVLAGLGAALCALPGLEAVVWHPARSWMKPDYYCRIVESWLAGGAFPALGLTTLEREGAGGMTSHGLTLFTGQELRLEGMERVAPNDQARIAMRLLHELVSDGPVDGPRDYLGPAGQVFHAVPDGRFVRVTLEG